MARVDLTVRGGGILGLSVAWAAARRGARVRLIEKRAIGAGASGGLVGALAPHTPEQWNEKKAFQLDSLLMAEDWWAEVARAGDRDPGYARLGRLQPLSDDHAVQLAKDRIATASELWRGRASWQVVPATGTDFEPASPTGLLIRDTLTARLHPRQAAAALVAAIRARGGEVIVADDGIDSPAMVPPATGTVIWATGVAGLDTLGATTGRKAGAGVKGQALSLGFDAHDLPQIFADGVHIVPHADGTTAIGSTSENDWTDATTTDSLLDALQARAVTLVPALARAPVLERWAGLRPRARSRAPVVGRWPGQPGHFIANGGFKIGFGMAPKIAETLADLILDGRDAIPAGFRPEPPT